LFYPACADEVNAIVLDVGTYQVKAGYAGEDTPKFAFPSVGFILCALFKIKNGAPASELWLLKPWWYQAVGIEAEKEKDEEKNMDVDDASNTQKFRLGMQGVGVWREGMEVGSPFTNGIVSNWDALEALWSYTLTDQMRLNAEDHPMMLTEPSFNTNNAREKMVELMFEKYKVPGMGLPCCGHLEERVYCSLVFLNQSALWRLLLVHLHSAVFLAKNAVLSSFAMARQTSLVVDIGHENTVGKWHNVKF
jgi:actin-like protein 6A